MKTKLFFLISILSLSIIANAQKGFHAGLKVGANINQINGESFKNEFSYGYHAGVFVSIPLIKKLTVQPEILFNQVQMDTTSKLSQLYNINSNITKIKLSYLSIPVLLCYKASKFLTIQAGPQFGIMMDQNKDLLQNGKTAFKTGDLGILGGVQLNFASFRIYGRYVLGLNNINDIDNKDKWKSQSIQIGIGVKLF